MNAGIKSAVRSHLNKTHYTKGRDGAPHNTQHASALDFGKTRRERSVRPQKVTEATKQMRLLRAVFGLIELTTDRRNRGSPAGIRIVSGNRDDTVSDAGVDVCSNVPVRILTRREPVGAVSGVRKDWFARRGVQSSPSHIVRRADLDRVRVGPTTRSRLRAA